MPDTKQNEEKSNLCKCPPEALMTLAMSVALAMSKGLTSDEILVLADIFSIVGSDLTLIGDQLALCRNSSSPGQNGGDQGGNQQSKEQQSQGGQSGQDSQQGAQDKQNQKGGQKKS